MVTIIGGWQSDFSRNWAREGNEIADGFAEALARGLEETGLEPSDIQTGHVGNFVADMFAKQGLLGGLFAQVHPELDGLPTSRHEAARPASCFTARPGQGRRTRLARPSALPLSSSSKVLL